MKKSSETMQAKLNIQAPDAEYSKHDSCDAEDKKAKSDGWGMIIAKLLPIVTLPLVILLLLPPVPIFTENDSDNLDEKLSVSRRLR